MGWHPECPRRSLLRLARQYGRTTHDLVHPRIPTARLSTPSLHNHLYALRHTHLPSELVCTENLTPPLKKTAPIPRESEHRDAAQPAQADRRGLPWTWDQRCVEEGGVVDLKVTVQGVFDPFRTSPDGKRDWALRSMFGRTVECACPVASSSSVKTVTNGVVDYTLEPKPTVDWSADQVEGVEGWFYKLESVAHPDALSELDLSMRWLGESRFAYPLDLTVTTLSTYSVDRSMKVCSQTSGELALSIRNNLQVERVLWLETLPWHVELYLYTLHVTCADGRACDELLGNLTYTPPVPHASGALLQTDVLLPPGEHLQITARVRKSFLRYTEHPPEAQRAWDLPPCVLLSLKPPALRSFRTSQRVYTKPLMLVDIATPDFSMSYNVIIMTCTLIVLCFGSVFNMLTRRSLMFDAEGKKVAGGEGWVVEGEKAADETRPGGQSLVMIAVPCCWPIMYAMKYGHIDSDHYTQVVKATGDSH